MNCGAALVKGYSPVEVSRCEASQPDVEDIGKCSDDKQCDSSRLPLGSLLFNLLILSSKNYNYSHHEDQDQS